MRPTPGIAVVQYDNGCLHVAGGSLLAFETAVPGSWWRDKARKLFSTVVLYTGGVAWDDRGKVSVVLPEFTAPVVLDIAEAAEAMEDNAPGWFANRARLGMWYEIISQRVECGLNVYEWAPVTRREVDGKWAYTAKLPGSDAHWTAPWPSDDADCSETTSVSDTEDTEDVPRVPEDIAEEKTLGVKRGTILTVTPTHLLGLSNLDFRGTFTYVDIDTLRDIEHEDWGNDSVIRALYQDANTPREWLTRARAEDQVIRRALDDGLRVTPKHLARHPDICWDEELIEKEYRQAGGSSDGLIGRPEVRQALLSESESDSAIRALKLEKCLPTVEGVEWQEQAIHTMANQKSGCENCAQSTSEDNDAGNKEKKDLKNIAGELILKMTPTHFNKVCDRDLRGSHAYVTVDILEEIACTALPSDVLTRKDWLPRAGIEDQVINQVQNSGLRVTLDHLFRNPIIRCYWDDDDEDEQLAAISRVNRSPDGLIGIPEVFQTRLSEANRTKVLEALKLEQSPGNAEQVRWIEQAICEMADFIEQKVIEEKK